MVTPSDVLRNLRQEAGLSQREFASRAGTSQSTLSAYERGEKSPTLDTLERLASSVGKVPVVTFLPGLGTVCRTLREHFTNVNGADEIWIFGSYVPFIQGRTSRAPVDIDVLVVGEVDRSRAGRAARLAEQKLGIHVDLVLIEPSAWSEDTGFVRTVKKAPRLSVL